MPNKYRFKLYVAGIAPDNQKLIVIFKKKLTKILETDNFSLEIIDVLERPHLADEERILATPTVVRMVPLPIKKVILNLDSQLESMIGFDLIVKDQEDANDSSK